MARPLHPPQFTCDNQLCLMTTTLPGGVTVSRTYGRVLTRTGALTADNLS